MIRIYAYKNCDTCRKALQFLKAHSVPHEVIAIRETPPSPRELQAALDSTGGDLRRLFNTSGVDYREMNLKEKLPRMTPDEAIGLLSGNGNLVKRPLVIGNGIVLAGFKEEEWRSALPRLASE